jgi:arsenate reductase-like glutaredoxin family protein
VREFLARNKVPHTFEDVRKSPVAPEDALALVRRHRLALVKRGKNVVQFEVAAASDEEILKHFLGREGTLRAPTVSVGDTIVAGFDEDTFVRLLG